VTAIVSHKDFSKLHQKKIESKSLSRLQIDDTILLEGDRKGSNGKDLNHSGVVRKWRSGPWSQTEVELENSLTSTKIIHTSPTIYFLFMTHRNV
jgi:hypothetical protein